MGKAGGIKDVWNLKDGIQNHGNELWYPEENKRKKRAQELSIRSQGYERANKGDFSISCSKKEGEK